MVLTIGPSTGTCETYYAILSNTMWYYPDYKYSYAFLTSFRCNSKCVMGFLINLEGDVSRSAVYWYEIIQVPYSLVINVKKKHIEAYYYYHYNEWILYSIRTRVFRPGNTYSEHKVKIGKKTLSLAQQGSIATIVPSMTSNLI